jgi:hypothetical protein
MAFRYCCVPLLSNFPKSQIESSNYLGERNSLLAEYTCDYFKYYTYVHHHHHHHLHRNSIFLKPINRREVQ